MEAVATYDLSKRFDGQAALRSLNLQVAEGAAFACVGERGAGKTTLIRLLSGLSRPTDGECSVLGFSPYFEADRLHAQAGTFLDTARLYRDRTLTENLLFFGELNGRDENDIADQTSFLLHRLALWPARDALVRDLPTGAVLRASLARALIHRPRLLLMDEPAGEMDRETSQAILALLRELVANEGMTLLFCGENMAFAQDLCGAFGLLHQGALLARGDLEELRRNAGVRYGALLRLGEGQRGPKGFRRTPDGLWGKEIASEEELAQATAQVIQAGNDLYEAKLTRPTLREIYEAVLMGGVQRAGEEEDADEDDQEPGTWGEPDEADQPAEGGPEAHDEEGAD